jgi:SAM-dependent methyltransferase
MSQIPSDPSEADLQRVSDGADLRHPALVDAMRDMGMSSISNEWGGAGQRAWEFAMCYRALQGAGLLRPDAVGLSFASGREFPLYAVSRSVGRIHATDLYTPDSLWVAEAKTEDPREFVLNNPPTPCRPEAIDVRRMDMREAEFPDGSMDFCYSISSMEHIGGDDDFLRHLREARRVLKDGGLYVLTTTIILHEDSVRQPGVYLFGPGHLRDLVGRSGFSAAANLWTEPSGDPRNTPYFMPGALLQEPESPMDIWFLYRTEPFGAVTLMLRKRAGDVGMAYSNLAGARQRLLELKQRRIEALWSAGAGVNPRRYQGFLESQPDHFCFSEILDFGSLDMALEIRLKGPFKGRVMFYLHTNPSRLPESVAQEQATAFSLDLPEGEVETRTLAFKGRPDTGFGVVGRRLEGQGQPEVEISFQQQKIRVHRIESDE